MSIAELLHEVIHLLQNHGVFVPADNNNNPVVKFLDPEDLRKQLNFTLSKEGETDPNKLSEILEKVLEFSVKTNHVHFRNQLYGAVDPYGLIGAWISEALNTSQYTFEVAPVFTLCETTVLEYVSRLVGFEEGAGGVFTPGGSAANMYGMSLARYKMFPDIKRKGIQGIQLVAFTSEDSHYSLDKAAHWLGIGTDNLIKIKTNAHGQMDVENLDLKIRESLTNGKTPFFINATAGTTVLGAFDPLKTVGKIARKYGLWLHVDACWGGSAILSQKWKFLLTGLNQCDSFAWNPHKMLGAPLQCSMFLCNDQKLLKECNGVGSTQAGYLFQPDKLYDPTYDHGDKSIQCGRKIDAFKLWVMWKIRGDHGFEELIDNAMDCAKYLRDKLVTTDGFVLVQDHFQFTNVCFWYVPEKYRELLNEPGWEEKIGWIAARIKAVMIKSGSLMVGYAPLKNRGFGNFFRMVLTCHPPATKDDMDFVLEEIIRCGREV